TWRKPITIARHAYGDIYSGVESLAGAGSRAELLLTDTEGTVTKAPIHDFDGPGVIQGIHNTDKSIRSFARSCFRYALDTGQDIWFASKDTISKTYDHRFKDIFEEVYTEEFKAIFAEAGISYEYTLIDDMVARVIRSEGGFIWACKNYDGDVMSDMVAAACGSLAMMTSVLVSPIGAFEYEAAHGTVQKHFYRYKAGETTSTNSIATIFAWSGALRKRGELDNHSEMANFADCLEKAVTDTVEAGIMTGDLIGISNLEHKVKAETKDFLKEVGIRLKHLLKKNTA
ncbi:MAG: NADP-dependent isocitrate dehydrogenase, partial [Oscillospiraceae bacterium]|nr:NADP-dependent isocitrate dehydrogenase [Oscillospiraceae bacterium]